MAGQRDLVAAAKRGAVEGRDEGLAAFLNAAHQGVQLGDKVHHAGHVGDGEHHVEVGAGDEFGLGGCDDHALDGRIRLGTLHGVGEGGNGLPVEDVHRHVLHGPGDGGDAVGINLVVNSHGGGPGL